MHWNKGSNEFYCAFILPNCCKMLLRVHKLGWEMLHPCTELISLFMVLCCYRYPKRLANARALQSDILHGH